jgi:hypothetical protein
VDRGAEDGLPAPVVTDFARRCVIEGAVVRGVLGPDVVADRRVVVEGPEHVPCQVVALACCFAPVDSFAVGFFERSCHPGPFAFDNPVLC